jgi:hypothetical protein
MNIITDGRKLRHLARKLNFTYDKEYKYITGDGYNNWYEFYKEVEKNGYKVKYFDGCFYPYLCKI